MVDVRNVAGFSLSVVVLLGCAETDEEQPSQTGSSSGTDSGAVTDSTSSTESTTAGDTESGTTGSTGTDTSVDATSSGETTTGDPAFEPPQETWRVTSTFGSVASICAHADDDIVMVGSRATSLDPGEAYVQAVSADGQAGWRSGFGDSQTATCFYEVTCAPDGSVYAVGASGEGLLLSPIPIMVKLDGETGDTLWTVNLDESLREGQFYGAFADDTGV